MSSSGWTRRIAIALFGLALLPATAASGATPHGGTDPVMSRGIAPDKTYSVDDVEVIDTLTGNLMLNIPLGQVFGTSGSLQYQFTLFYNSRAWDYIGHGHELRVGASRVLRGIDGFSRDFRGDQNDGTIAGTESVPFIGTNAGLGWAVAAGGYPRFEGMDTNADGSRFWPRISWVTPDGSVHQFYNDLHGPADGGLNPDPRQNQPALVNGQPFYYYTRDGSYFRMQKTPLPGCGNDTPDCDRKRLIEAPDGTKYRVSCPDGGACNSVSAQWYLDEIEDPYGSKLTISRTSLGQSSPAQPDPPPGAGNEREWTWTYTETNVGMTDSRVHKIVFAVRRRTGSSTATPANWGDVELLVKNVRLQVDSTAYADYNFAYSHPFLIREAKTTWGDTREMVIPFAMRDQGGGTCEAGEVCEGFMDQALLKEVALPAGIAGGASAGKWQFKYWGPDFPLDDVFQGPTWIHGVPYKLSRTTGALGEVIYPTGRGWQYTFGRRSFVKAGCYLPGSHARRFLYEYLTGVKRKTMTRPAASGRALVPRTTWTFGTYSFLKSLTSAPAGGDETNPIADQPCLQIPREATAITVDPSGKATVSFYSAYVTGPIPDGKPWKRQEYGLPISHEEYAPNRPADDPLPVSEHVYDCSTANIHNLSGMDLYTAMRGIVQRNRFAGQAPTCGANNALPLRATYQKLEYSPVCDETLETGACSQGNRRVKSSVTWFWDVCDATGCRYQGPGAGTTEPTVARWRQAVHSDFDGLGHYRTTQTTSDISADSFTGAADNRSETTSYNGGVAWDPSTRMISFAASADWIRSTWITNTYDQKSTTEAGVTYASVYDFDHQNGFLKSVQTAYRTLPTARSVKVSFERSVESDGKVKIVETTAGGDFRDLSSAEYQINRRYWRGRPVSVEYWDCKAGQSVYSPYTATPNLKTALPLTETDGTGRVATYTYDPLLRVKTVQPAADEATYTHTYPPLTGGAAAQHATSTRTDTVAGTTSAKVTANDDFRQNPWVCDNPDTCEWLLWSESWTNTKNLNVSGRSWTLVSPLGRIRYTTTPNASNESTALAKAAATEHIYDVFGRVVKTIPPDGGSQAVTYSYSGTWADIVTTNGVAGAGNPKRYLNRDAFGRLVKVSEMSADTLDFTRYDYDPAGKLVKVSHGAQTREFLYDARGLAQIERQPELGDQEIRYYYDSRGNVVRRLLRPKNGTVSTTDTGSALLTTSFGPFDQEMTYDAGERLTAVEIPNSQAGATRGKAFKSFTYQGSLVRISRRENYLSDPARVHGVETEHVYDASGRMKEKILRGGGMQASVHLGYDKFGQLSSVRYPHACASGPCNDTSDRTLLYTNVNGALNRVTEGSLAYIDSVDYHANGMWKQITRGALGARRSTDSQEILAGGLERNRPSAISTTSGFAQSIIEYDGAGNVSQINADLYRYDAVFRLKQAVLAIANGAINQQFTYDRYGNITKFIRNGASEELKPAVSNRLTNGGVLSNVTYDAAGNLTKWSDARGGNGTLEMFFDAASMPVRGRMTNADGTRQFDRVYLYDAHDERVATISYSSVSEALRTEQAQSSVTERWTVRGPSNELMTEFTASLNDSGVRTWAWSRDYVHALGRAVVEIRKASPAPQVYDLHWDHLGSVRCVSLGTGGCAPLRRYLPFGQEVVSRPRDEAQPRFTGHERDEDGSPGQVGDLDYMHARFYAPMMGRFLSVDPSARSVMASAPQSWNRYTYSLNRPVSVVDPDGAEPKMFIYNYGEGYPANIWPTIPFRSIEYTTGMSVHTFDVPGSDDRGRLYRTLDTQSSLGARDVAIHWGHGSAIVGGEYSGAFAIPAQHGGVQMVRAETISGAIIRQPPGMIILAACNSGPGMSQAVANQTGTVVLGLSGVASMREYLLGAAAAAGAFAAGATPEQAAARGSALIKIPCPASMCGEEGSKEAANFVVYRPNGGN